jgi:hypothetical protein
VLRAEEGSLYPALHRMEEAGWIRAEWIRLAGWVESRADAVFGSLAILAAALLASLPAAIRAVRIDPVTMLRSD